MKIYSAKLLLESIVVPNPAPLSKAFEETIVLVRTDNKESIEKMVKEHFVDHSYENAIGGMTTWRFVTILDICELVDHFDEEVNFKEVYYRYLHFEKMMTTEEVIKLYSLDK